MSGSQVNFGKKYEVNKSSVFSHSPISNICVKDFFRNRHAPIFEQEFRSCFFDGRGSKNALMFFYDFEKTFIECNFKGGENILNISRGGNISFIDCVFEIGAHTSLGRVDAGARNILFERCVFSFSAEPQGLFTLFLGGWSIWNIIKRPFVFNVKFKDCKVSGVKNMRALSLYAARAQVENSPIRAFYIPNFIVSPYFFFKKILTKIFNKKIPSSAYILDKEEFDV